MLDTLQFNKRTTFFLHLGPVYWDLTLPMFVIQQHNIVYSLMDSAGGQGEARGGLRAHLVSGESLKLSASARRKASSCGKPAASWSGS